MNSSASKPLIDDKLKRELMKPVVPQNQPAETISAPRIPLQRCQELERAIQNNPANPTLYRELGEIYLSENRWKDARRVLQRGVQHNDQDESLLMMLEESRLRGCREAMLAAAKDFEYRKTPSARTELDQSELELAIMQHEIAESRFTRHPEQTELLITSAISLNRLGQLDEAIKRFEQAKQDPAIRALASLNLGMCLERRGEAIEALAAYRRAAIFRAPPPSNEIRTKALKLAVALAEKIGLHHSAIRYKQMLLPAEEQK